MDIPRYLLVETKNLPDVYLKVVNAKKLLAQGKAKNSSEAAKMAGISRSAYYKYKDSVYSYDKDLSEKMINIHLKLEDEPGILSNVLANLYKVGTNIITVNQNIPVDSVAPVSICAKINKPELVAEDIIKFLENLNGVVEAKNIS
ncbi:MAG: ACT domain-containing protein [Oscillospiraceae bacterium]